jgi:photosynthetic reaction center H subunit
MINGAIFENIDIAQLVLVGFFIFFGGLILYLRQEDKREGYPLKDPAGRPDSVGFPGLPAPKTFLLMEGGQVSAPHPEIPRDLAARRLHPNPGSPLTPVGDPLLDGVGPAAFALRRDQPMIYRPGELQMAPMRVLEGWSITKGDPDPRGMMVVGVDGVEVGQVLDLWIDRGVKILRYLEVAVTAGPSRRTALVPIYHADIQRDRRRVKVGAVRAAQFAYSPELRHPDRITALEEDQVNAFYAGGKFFQGVTHLAGAAR